MQIEYEAKFLDIDKEEMRKRLEGIGAVLEKPEFLQKRYNLHLPGELRDDMSWLRVRDEQDKITMSLKKVDGHGMHNQKELCLEINNFQTAVDMLKLIGCEVRMYQETKRELWMFDSVEITIDTWPFLEPFIEIEGASEESVKGVAEKLGMEFEKAVFGPVGKVYKMKYGIGPSFHDGENSRLTFEDENPFEKYLSGGQSA